MAGLYDRFRTHRQSRRLAGHDYASAGWYFVTICVAARRCVFGEVRDGVVRLSDVGRIAQACWVEIPEHQPRARLDAFVVMPNHVHGLIGLGTEPGRPPPPRAEPHLRLAPRSLSSIVGAYKAAVTRSARPLDAAFAWQPRFHDRVVRSEPERIAIRTYIEANPVAWQADRLRPSP